MINAGNTFKLAKRCLPRPPEKSRRNYEDFRRSTSARSPCRCWQAPAGRALTQNSASDFSYPVQEETSGDDIWWSLRLGAWHIRTRYPEDLNQIVKVHNILLVDASQWVEFLSMRKYRAACQETILEFQKALTPDVSLRHLISNGSCDVCLRGRTANAEPAT